MESAYNQIEDFLIDEDFKSWVLNPTPELTAQWSAWKQENPKKVSLFEKAEQVARRLEFSTYQAETATKEEILKRIKTETQDWNQTKHFTLWNNWVRVAAAILIAFGLGYLFSELTLNSDQNKRSAEIVYRENPYGIRSHYLLSDGSEVYLNAGSSIEFPKNFEVSERVVKIKGEAYFEVKSDKKRPFKVVSNEMTVTVLGTKFNFNSDAGQNSVALIEGKVEYQDNTSGSSIIMKPGQLASFDTKASKFNLSDFDQNLILGWKNGVLVFRDASLDQVAHNLEKWYGVEISIETSGKSPDWSYTASFSNESLETVLLNMSTVKNFSYEIDGRNVRIDF